MPRHTLDRAPGSKRVVDFRKAIGFRKQQLDLLRRGGRLRALVVMRQRSGEA